jgi:inosine-uridine nucleoside N-ribohydrolase
MTLLPRDVSARAAMTFDLLNHLPSDRLPSGRLLRSLLPGAFQSYRQRLGLEGMYVAEAIAVVAALHPELFSTERLACDVETEGAITYGATVIDRRQRTLDRPNMDVVVDLDVPRVVEQVFAGLREGG